MYPFTLEHSRSAYVADFILYGTACALMALGLIFVGPHEQWLELMALAMVGLASWPFIEYALHRFCLHGLRPFSTWHAVHHQRPAALICTPTLLSASLILLLVFVPALVLGDMWQACALTFGLLTGYLIYAITHHALHHWHVDSAWLRRRKRWHALHHDPIRPPGHYGVTSAFWDHVFGSHR